MFFYSDKLKIQKLKLLFYVLNQLFMNGGESISSDEKFIR